MLTISFLLIFNGYVSFLTPDFVYSEIYCQNEEMNFHTGTDVKWTGHRYKLPEGEWECVATAFGEGILYPSERDIVSKFFINPK